MIEKIQKEVDEQNKRAESRRKEEEIKKEDELKFDKNKLVSFDLTGIENAVKFLLSKVEKLDGEVDKCK